MRYCASISEANTPTVSAIDEATPTSSAPVSIEESWLASSEFSITRSKPMSSARRGRLTRKLEVPIAADPSGEGVDLRQKRARFDRAVTRGELAGFASRSGHGAGRAHRARKSVSEKVGRRPVPGTGMLAAGQPQHIIRARSAEAVFSSAGL